MRRRECLAAHGVLIGLPRMLAITILAGACAMSLPACGGSAGQGDAAASDSHADSAAQTTDSTADQEADPSEDDAGAETVSWPEECLDRKDGVTAYAVLELTGTQLHQLLEENGYEWSERNQLWLKEGGSAALEVIDAKGKPLSRSRIEELGPGGEQDQVSYRIVSGDYSNVNRAYNGLVGRVLTCDDVATSDAGKLAVAVGPSQHKALVLVHESNGVIAASVVSAPAVEAGLFDQLAGREVGSSLDAVFEALVGRAPGEVQ